MTKILLSALLAMGLNSMGYADDTAQAQGGAQKTAAPAQAKGEVAKAQAPAQAKAEAPAQAKGEAQKTEAPSQVKGEVAKTETPTQAQGEAQKTETQTQGEVSKQGEVQKPEQMPEQKPEQMPDKGKVAQVPVDWTCRVQGTMSGLAISIGLGGKFLHGRGMITCQRDGEQAVLPIELHVIAGGLGLDFTYIRHIDVIADGIRTSIGPRAFVGFYNVGASAGYTLIGMGYDAESYAALTTPVGLKFEVGLVGEDAVGLGVRLHGTALHIEAAD